MSVKVVIITMMTSLAHGDMASGSGSRVNEEAQLCGLAAGLSCECWAFRLVAYKMLENLSSSTGVKTGAHLPRSQPPCLSILRCPW